MLPSQLREVLFRMAQMPAVEHRQPYQDKGLAMHRHNGKLGSKYGRMGREKADLVTPVRLNGSPVFKKRSMTKGLKRPRHTGPRKG
jgi:hypothetical protein